MSSATSLALAGPERQTATPASMLAGGGAGAEGAACDASRACLAVLQRPLALHARRV